MPCRAGEREGRGSSERISWGEESGSGGSRDEGIDRQTDRQTQAEAKHFVSARRIWCSALRRVRLADGRGRNLKSEKIP